MSVHIMSAQIGSDKVLYLITHITLSYESTYELSLHLQSKQTARVPSTSSKLIVLLAANLIMPT